MAHPLIVLDIMNKAMRFNFSFHQFSHFIVLSLVHLYIMNTVAKNLGVLTKLWSIFFVDILDRCHKL